MLFYRLFVFNSYITRSLSILNCPAVLPIEDHSYFRLHTASLHFVQLLKYVSNLSYITEYTGMLMSNMINNSTMEFLARATTLPPLEILN
ncbi:hypothetical protein D3C76_1680110 [compost metagenome]